MRTRSRRILLLPWLRKPIRQFARRPFGRLVAHFLQKLVRGGQDDASSELDFGAGILLGILAAPGAFASMLMLDKYSAFLNWMRGKLGEDLYVTSAPDKHLFLCVAMAVTGIVTILKWDQILPDAQDYLNLSHLPVSSRRILFANTVAILVAVVVVALDVSLIPSVLFPMFVTAAARFTFVDFLWFAAAHASTVILASVFSIASVFGILGSVSAVLPRETFRSWSPWLRGFLLLAMIALLFAGFSGQPASRFLPSVWFLGLYQVIQNRPTPFFAEVAQWALWVSPPSSRSTSSLMRQVIGGATPKCSKAPKDPRTSRSCASFSAFSTCLRQRPPGLDAPRTGLSCARSSAARPIAWRSRSRSVSAGWPGRRWPPPTC